MFLATFPTTVIFLVVIFCQIRITSAPMNVLIFTCQVSASMINANPYLYTDVSKPSYYVALFFLTIYGVFNLDFFRYVIPQFCISSTMTTIQALSLEYVVAFYPLLLIIVFYTCIQAHARGCKLLVYLWRPFQRCCACISRRWNPMESLVHAFAAFLLLSYSKILSVSFKLLHHGRHIEDSGGTKVGHLILFYNATIPYFGAEHLPFALLAIFILATFVVLPVLILLLYPAQPEFFRSVLVAVVLGGIFYILLWMPSKAITRMGAMKLQIGDIFSGMYLIFRIMAIAIHVLPDTKYRVVYRVTCYNSASLFFGLVQPYKEKWVNYVDSIGFMLLSFVEFIATYDEYDIRSHFGFGYALAVVPLIYLSVYAGYKILSRMGLLHHCTCALCCKNQAGEASSIGDVEREAYMYANSEEGKPLLATTS